MTGKIARVEEADVVLQTLTTEGGSLVISNRARLPEDHPAWQAMLSYSGPDHPTVLGLPPRAAYGYGSTPAEALAALTDDLRADAEGRG